MFIIPAAGGYGVLRSQARVCDLENGACIVIKPPDQPVVKNKRDIRVIEIDLHGIEMRSAILADMIEYGRGVRNHLIAGLHLAVKDPQRIARVFDGRRNSNKGQDNIAFLDMILDPFAVNGDVSFFKMKSRFVL